MKSNVPNGRRQLRWQFVFALSAALTLHVGLLLVVREALRWRPSFDGPAGPPMQLRLIHVELQPAKVAPAHPLLPRAIAVQAPPSAAPMSRRKKKFAPIAAVAPAEVVERTAARVPLAIVPGPPAQDSSSSNREQEPRLVAPDGRVYIPDVDVAVAAAAGRFPVKPMAPAAGASLPFSHRSPLPYVATRFDPLWVPDGETLLGTFLRKLSDKVVKKSSTQVAGLQIDCVWMVVIANCSWGAPSRMSIDELKKLRADVPFPRGPNTLPGH